MIQMPTNDALPRWKRLSGSFCIPVKQSRGLSRHRPLLGAVLICLLTLFFSYITQQKASSLFAEHEQLQAQYRIKSFAASLSAALAVRINTINSLGAFVASHRLFSEQEFDLFTAMLKMELPDVISMQLAQEGGVTYLMTGDRHRALRMPDPIADPQLRTSVLQATQARGQIVSGPISLSQADQVLVVRRALFILDPENDSEILWGVASVLIDLNAILTAASFVELNSHFLTAIRGSSAPGARGELFIGNQEIFNSALAIADILLPNGRWQIGVASKKPYRSSGFPLSFWYWAAAAVAALFCSRITYLILDRPYQLEQAIRQATESLTKEVQQRIKAERHIRHMAQHDSLTGLPNRRLFDELNILAIATAKREGTKLAFLFIDIDGFKLINDSLGHAAGDKVLQMISKRLRDRVRESDIVARFGGDEFIVLLTEKCDIAGAQTAAAEIIAVLSKPFSIGTETARVGASIGISIYPDHGTQMDELLKKSDAAMYSAKNNGKNSYRFANE